MSSLIVFQFFLLAMVVSAKVMIENEEELDKFLKTSKMSRESKQVLREYQRDGMLSFPLDPFNFLSQLQSLFAQLPNIFSSLFKVNQFFSPADTRISVDHRVKNLDE